MNTSVIIPCHNVGTVLGLQLECLALQEGAEPFEVLVVDNKSTDRTREVAEGWAGRLNLRIVEANRHQGVSYARNRGIGEARGEKLIFIDGDDAVPSDYIAYCQRSLDEVPVYVSGFDPVDSSEFDLGREHLMELIGSKLLPYQSPLPSEADPAWPILPGCSFGARKELMVELGGFDLAYEPGAEDNELAFRLQDAGYELRVQRSTTIAYRVDTTGRRPLKVHYCRAKSVALLKTVRDVWGEGQGIVHQAKSSFRALLAILKSFLLRQGNFHQASARLALSLGTLAGYVEYRILRKLPEPQLTRGIVE